MAGAPLEYALRGDDIRNFEQILYVYLSTVVITWINNPLLWACEYRSINCASEIVRLKPALACARHPDGYTVMHTICKIGDVQMVSRLLEICPRLFLLTDLTHRSTTPLYVAAVNGNEQVLREIVTVCPQSLTTHGSTTPLHVAAVNGNEQVLREIVTVCPQSLTTYTSQNETALHLALKHGHVGCFQVLLDQLVHLVDDQMINLKELLNHKDHEGNTLLHIATDRRQVQILKMCMDNPTIALLLDLNATNLSGLTASNLHNIHYQDHSGIIDMEITYFLLPDTLGSNNSEMMKEEEQSQNTANKRSHILMLNTLLLMVFLFAAAGTYNSVFNLNTIYAKEHSYDDGIGKAKNIVSLIDMVTMRVHVPEPFPFVVLNSIVFTGSLLVVVVKTWTVLTIKTWLDLFYFRALPSIVLGAMYLSYAVLVYSVTPKFFVSMGSLEVSSLWAVWLFPLLPIFFTLIVCLVFKTFFQSSYNLANKQAKGKIRCRKQCFILGGMR